MSELKTYKMVDEKYCSDCVCVIPSEVYLKSEVDATIAELNAENERLKEMTPKYKKFIEEEEFRKKLVDEYDGYVYDWKGRHYVATPYLNIFVKGILRALWLARAEIAKAMKAIDNLDNYLSLHKNSKWFGIYATRIDTWYYKWDNVERKCLKKAEEYK